MAYTDRPQTFRFLVDTKARDGANDMTPANLIADNTDLVGFIVPANREIEIQAVRAYVFAADGDANIEICKEDDTILCRVACTSTGHVSAIQSASSSAQTFPIRVAPQSTTLPKLIKLRTDAALDADTKVLVEVTVTGM
jgi:hypothetical protein